MQGDRADDNGTFLAEELSDVELLASVIGAGSLTDEGLKVAESVLASCERLGGLGTLSYGDFTLVQDLGQEGARAILSVLELGRRIARSEVKRGRRVSTSREVYELFLPILGKERSEVFYAALADSRLRLIKIALVARGSLTASIVHPREAYLPAVRYSASGTIFVHNHPSGDPEPSPEDFRLTGRLSEVGAVLGIPMLDHVVVTPGGYFSFADAGHLEGERRGDRGTLCSSIGTRASVKWHGGILEDSER